jgi:hypothetical protein
MYTYQGHTFTENLVMTDLSKAEFFKQFGYAFFENILAEEQCLNFSAKMLSLREDNKLYYEGKTVDKPNAFYDNSFGIGSVPEMEQVLRDMQPHIENELQVKMIPANSYARIYYNGGTLQPHVDRKGLDYTMSITLFSNIDNDWPLWCEDLQGNNVPLVIPRGWGGIMLGTTMKHWREPLVCRDDQYVIQLFVHWSFLNE